MRMSENRRVAWVVLAVCALTSIVGLGGGALARDRGRLMNVFYEGAQTDGTSRYSMDAYLDRAAECAREMAAEVQLHVDPANAAAGSAASLADAIADGDDTGARYDAYVQLQKDADLMYNAVYAATLTDAQRVNFKHAYDDFWGADKYIQRDPYRELAADFNGAREGFPAGAVSGLLGIDALDSFGAD